MSEGQLSLPAATTTATPTRTATLATTTKAKIFQIESGSGDEVSPVREEQPEGILPRITLSSESQAQSQSQSLVPQSRGTLPSRSPKEEPSRPLLTPPPSAASSVSGTPPPAERQAIPQRRFESVPTWIPSGGGFSGAAHFRAPHSPRSTPNMTRTTPTTSSPSTSHEGIVVSVTSSLLGRPLEYLRSLGSVLWQHGPILSQPDRAADIHYHKHLMQVASNHDQWHAAAAHLDVLEGNEAWKRDPQSPDYEFQLLQDRLGQLRKAHESRDISTMMFLLRTSLSRNLGDMGNPALYAKTHVGTKHLIEQYIDEVCRQLNYICDTEAPDFTLDDKLELFLNVRQAFGRTALLLSGGATMGLNHFGVIKALHECGLLPRIISGSSIGSLVAAYVCSKTDQELFTALHSDRLNLNALEVPEEKGNFFYRFARFLKHGVLFDVEVLKECIRDNVGDLTFQDAYNRTRRVLNITVSSSTKYEMPRLLNYLTAPNVLVWSAVAASCAAPLVYKSAPLMARDRLGNIVQWNPSGHRWIDGSVDTDLPMVRLAEMFNVNHFIVCQVNPHVVPFLHDSIHAAASSSRHSRSLLRSAFFLFRTELQHRLSQLIELEIMPTMLQKVQNILSQRYYGDITIVPNLGVGDYLQIVTNPTHDSLWDSIMKGEKATWPLISLIRNHCQIELTVDEIIYRLRIRRLDFGRIPELSATSSTTGDDRNLMTKSMVFQEDRLSAGGAAAQQTAPISTPSLTRSKSFSGTRKLMTELAGPRAQTPPAISSTAPSMEDSTPQLTQAQSTVRSQPSGPTSGETPRITANRRVKSALRMTSMAMTTDPEGNASGSAPMQKQEKGYKHA